VFRKLDAVAPSPARLLPEPLSEREWQFADAGRDADPTLFFPAAGERGSRRAAREATAKAICRRCPSLPTVGRRHPAPPPVGLPNGQRVRRTLPPHRRQPRRRRLPSDVDEMARERGEDGGEVVGVGREPGRVGGEQGVHIVAAELPGPPING